MATKSGLCLIKVFAGSSLVLGACGSDGTSGSSSNIESDTLAAVQASLDNTEESLDSARDAGRVCFETFRACAEADGADKDACRAELEGCLPEDAPPPPRCGKGEKGPHQGRDGGRDGQRPPPPPPGSDSDDDATRPPPARSGAEGGERPERDADGGMRPPPPHGGKHGGKHCGPPPVDHEELKACKDAAKAAIDSGEDREAVRAEHDACMRAVFDAHREEVCAHVAERCAAADADEARCAEMTDRCADANAP